MEHVVNQEIRELVNNFVDTLSDAWKRMMLEALTGAEAPGARGARARAPGKVNGSNGSNGHARAKGEKRAPEYLEAMGEKFVAFVAKNPGLRIEQINKQLGTTTKDLQLPIRKALADGTLKSKGEKRSTQYFAK